MEKRVLRFGQTLKIRLLSFRKLHFDGAARAALVGILASFIYGCATAGHLHTRAMLMGNEQAEKGNFIDAAKHYQEALEEIPDSLPAKRNLGLVLVKMGDYERALELLTAAAARYSDNSEFLYFYGECYRGLKRYIEAAEQYQKGLRQNPSDLRMTKALGWAWHKMNQNEWTISLLAPFLRNNPADHQIRLVLASALNAERKYSKAIDVLKFAESQNFELKSKDRITGEAEKMLIINALADSYAGQGNCKRAQELYGAVLRVRPFFDGALVGSALCHVQANSRQAAIRLLERAVQANPTSWEAHFQLGQLLESKETDRAKFYLSRFLQLTSGNEKIVGTERKKAKRILSKISPQR